MAIIKHSLIVAAFLLSGFAAPAIAQDTAPISNTVGSPGAELGMDTPGNPTSIDPLKRTPVPPVKSDRSSEWVVAPIPSYSPSQGWALGLVAQYIFKPAGTDPASPPSILGAVGFGTEMGSYGGGLGYLGHLDNDRWRVTAAGGYGLVNYDFFGIGNAAALQDHPIEVEQQMSGLLLQLLGRIAPNLYLGPRLYGVNINASARFKNSFVTLPPQETETKTIALGGKFQWDTRDNTFYPTTGNLANVTIQVFSEAFGSDFDYRAYEAEYNHYMPMSERDVLALRGYGRTVDGDVPFFDLSMFGQHNDLRGYEAGKYRDKLMLATQGEWRHMLNDWLGVVAFAGVGEVAPDPASLTADDLLWSAGAGLRFRIARDNPVNFRIDLAEGKDGTTFYMSVTEAF